MAVWANKAVGCEGKEKEWKWYRGQDWKKIFVYPKYMKYVQMASWNSPSYVWTQNYYYAMLFLGHGRCGVRTAARTKLWLRISRRTSATRRLPLLSAFQEKISWKKKTSLFFPHWPVKEQLLQCLLSSSQSWPYHSAEGCSCLRWQVQEWQQWQQPPGQPFWSFWTFPPVKGQSCVCFASNICQTSLLTSWWCSTRASEVRFSCQSVQLLYRGGGGIRQQNVMGQLSTFPPHSLSLLYPVYWIRSWQAWAVFSFYTFRKCYMPYTC